MPEGATEESQAASERYARYGEPAWDAMSTETLLSELGEVAPGGTALVAECRTGRLLRHVAREFDRLSRLVAVEGDRDLLDFARTTLASIERPPVFFNQQPLPSLQFADDVFDLALVSNGLSTTAQVYNAVSELVRVVAPGGLIGVAAFGAGSVRVFDELIDEAVWSRDDADLAARVADLRARRVTVDDFEAACEHVGACVVRSGTVTTATRLGRGRDLLEHPIVARDVVPLWRELGSAAGDVLADAAQRAAVWWGQHRIEDQVEVCWAVLRVDEAEPIAVDETDVVEVVSANDDDVEVR